jgi:hypothetical protein
MIFHSYSKGTYYSMQALFLLTLMEDLGLYQAHFGLNQAQYDGFDHLQAAGRQKSCHINQISSI